MTKPVSGDLFPRGVQRSVRRRHRKLAKSWARLRKPFCNVHLHVGHIVGTLPDFLARNPALKVALPHLDLDAYESTAFALERLLPVMVKGGLVLFNGYGLVEGATRAGDEITSRPGAGLEKLPHAAVPAVLRVT